MKDFISFLAGAIFIEELLADDGPATPAQNAGPDEAEPLPVEPVDDPDDQ